MAEGAGLLHSVAHDIQLFAGDGLRQLYVNRALVQGVALLRQHLARAVETGGKDADAQLLGYVEGSLMEAGDAAVGRACALGKDGDAVASLYERAQTGHERIDALADRIVLDLTDDEAVEGIAPYPVVGKEHHARREHHEAHQVEVRLVVADDDVGRVKVLCPGLALSDGIATLGSVAH